jgi:hypothetical protein
MELLSKEELVGLGNYRGEHCISIYVPTHKSGSEVNERYDQIVFKNNLQRAKTELSSKGLDPLLVDRILKPGFELLKDDDFWHNQWEGLAVFISEDFFNIVKVPYSVKEEFLLNHSFLIAPLLPAVSKRHHFYMLVISKADCKFYEGDQFGMHKLEVEGLPFNMQDVVPFERKDPVQTHRRAGAAAGRGATVGASFHGHGSGLADEDEYMLQYFKEVDQTLWKEVLHNRHVPLIIAAVEFEIALYKQVSNYKHIAEEHLTGNFEHEDRNSLYLKAKEKLGGYFKEYTNKALKSFYDSSATELASAYPTEVIPAAYYAQVSDLFVEKDTHLWGTFDENDNKLDIHLEKQPQDDCLINNAIIKTLMNGGEVHLLDKEKMPADGPIAAFLRFAV